ncbi:MAG TPA: hypothetical protein VHF47_12070 [Acidimicrobiales bacterium]|nr:hypothetical protein [Acidimicrobiales bacterium]
MSHMVVFRSAEGKPGYHQADTLDDAVRFVERLRNQEGVNDSRVFRMEEVPLEFRTYVKVEVAGTAPSEPAPPVDEVERSGVLADDPVVVDPVPAGNGQAGRFNRFNRT